MKTQKGFFMIFILFIGYLNAFCQTSDTIPPMLNSINFVPQQVNNGDSLEIRLNITDNLSGVNFIALFFRSPSGSQYAEAQGSSTWIRQNDSIFIAKIKMNDWAENGNWYISQVQITDSANNTFVDFTNTNDTIATFQVVSNNEDITPPSFNSISFTPQPVNNGDSLEIRINVTDEVSGVDFIALFFRSPSGSQYAEAQGSSSWIRQNDSIFIAKIKMNDWAENGNWYISQVQITDSANNTYVDFTSTNDTIATFLVNGVSSVLNLDSYVNIELYPNPSSGIVYLSNSLNIKSLSIFDYSGKIVTNINEMGKNYLDLTNLTKGLYIFHIVTDKNLLIMRKILIE